MYGGPLSEANVFIGIDWMKFICSFNIFKCSTKVRQPLSLPFSKFWVLTVSMRLVRRAWWIAHGDLLVVWGAYVEFALPTECVIRFDFAISGCPQLRTTRCVVHWKRKNSFTNTSKAIRSVWSVTWSFPDNGPTKEGDLMRINKFLVELPARWQSPWQSRPGSGKSEQTA